MAHSIIVYTSDGSTNNHVINFTLGIISRNDVTCTVNGVSRTLTWINDGLVTINGAALVNGDLVVLKRTVDKTQLINDYDNGSAIEESNLDLSNKQTLMSIHETLDGRLESVSQNLDMQTYKVTNLGAGVSSTDAVNKAQLDAIAGSATAAAASAAAAATSASGALSSKNSADADVILTHADAVTTAADVVLTNADVVLTHADVVTSGTNATNAAASAASALGYKNTSSTNATATAADVVSTHADVVLTHADVVLTHADAASTATDAGSALSSKNSAAADVVLTHADVVLTHADVVLTHADVTTAGNSATAAAASESAALGYKNTSQTNATATAADVVLTHADVVLTHADVTSSSTSATNAASSATAAAAARDAALAAFDNFDDVYLGAKSVAPTLDNDSDPLTAGDLYYDTVIPGMQIWTGSAWVAAYISGAGYMAAANNLSELTNKTTARNNLDLGITNTATFDKLNLNATTNQVVLDADATNKGTISMATLTASRTWTFPDLTGTLATLDGAQALTNKTIVGASNTISGITETMLSTSNITTLDVSTSKHGFAPILPNDATKYLDGTGAYSVPAGRSNVLGSVKLKGTSAGGVKTATFTADQLCLGTTLSGSFVTRTSASLSFNGAGTGANGMDTGSMPTNSNLYIYAIWNGTTLSCLGTTAGSGANIYAGANMPSGYTYSVLIWAGVTTGTNFMNFQQYGNSVEIAGVTILNNTVGKAALTSLSISSAVPDIATTASGSIQQNQATGTAQEIIVGSDSNAGFGGGIGSHIGPFVNSANTITNTFTAVNFRHIPLITAQTIYYSTSNTTAGSVSLAIQGYEF